MNPVGGAVPASPDWKHTVLVFTYDEWGGFFEPAPPPAAPIPAASAAAGDRDGLLGFRLPCVVVSPYVPRGVVSHTPFDHTSVLRMIEWRWNLQPLTVRDATPNKLATALDFGQPHRTAPLYAISPGPYRRACAHTPHT